jgi:HlyD family secretion protein
MEPVTAVPRNRLRRWLVAVVVLAGLVSGGWFAYAWYTKPTPVTYTTAAAAKTTIIQSVTAAGTVNPVVQVEVGSQVSGRIKDLKADFNDHVTKGEILATIDPQVFQSQVDQANAKLVSARADLAKAKAVVANSKAQYDREHGLEASGAVAKTEIDAALAQWQSDQANVQSMAAAITQAQAALDQAKTSLAYTTISSPIDGVVISRNVDVGQTVAASLSAPTLFVIAGDLKQMEVHTSVAESDVGQLTEGMKVTFNVEAYPERTFTGSVKQVRFAATTISNVVTYDAVIGVQNDDLALRPGMTANATFVIAERDDVLAVPAKALRYKPAGAQAGGPGGGGHGGAGGSGGSGHWHGHGGGSGSDTGSGSAAASGSGSGSASAAASGSGSGSASGSGSGSDQGGGMRHQAVWVLRNNQPVRVSVQVGLSDGSTTEITGGDLQEGDLVITADSTSKTGASGGSGSASNKSRMPRGAF